MITAAMKLSIGDSIYDDSLITATSPAMLCHDIPMRAMII